MPIIHAEILAGRSWELRRALMARLTDAAVETLDVPRQSVRVILTEVPPCHWAVGGEPKEDPPA